MIEQSLAADLIGIGSLFEIRIISRRFWASATPPAIVIPRCLFLSTLNFHYMPHTINDPAFALLLGANTTPSLQVKAQVVVPFVMCSAI